MKKIRIRNTARVIPAKSNPTNTKDNKGAAKDKICEDFNKNDCKFSSDHAVGVKSGNMHVLIVLRKWVASFIIRPRIAYVTGQGTKERTRPSELELEQLTLIDS